MQRFPHSFLLLAAVGCLTSCAVTSDKMTNETAEDSAIDIGVVEPEVDSDVFLATGFEALETWLDKRFKVRYERMPLHQVFDEDPLAEIIYKKVNLPEDAPLFALESPSISRRELLEQIALFFQLEMRVEMENGAPSHVLVMGPDPATDGEATFEVDPELGAPRLEAPEEPSLGT